jgi:hypothetical protein
MIKNVTTLDVDTIEEGPWTGRDGGEESLDGTPAFRLTKTDVDAVLFHYCAIDGSYDGKVAVVVRLTQGRGYAAWESWWGPTGSGFGNDAYGGDAVVYFGASVPVVLSSFGEDALGEVLRSGLMDADVEAAYRLGGGAAIRSMLRER